MSRIIDLTTDANQKQDITVDGQPVTVIMRFADIPENWYFSVFDLSTNISIADGVRATTNVLLLANKATDFRGNFAIITKSDANQDQDVTRDNLGVTHFLNYFSEDELS